MKYLIVNSNNSHLMTISVFNTEKEAKQAKTKYTKFWNKFSRLNPTNKIKRLDAWKTCKIRPIDFSKRFCDFCISATEDIKRGNHKRLSTILSNYDDSIVSDKLKRYTKNQKR